VGEFMNKGFTLVELVVVVVVSGIIMTGIYSAFKNQQDSYLAHEQVVETQQNLRAGLYIMTKEIRMAGYDGGNNTSHCSCGFGAPSSGTPVSPGILAVTANQLDISMDLNSDGDCADNDENLSYYLYTSDGIQKLGRRDNTSSAPASQAVAENFENLEFVYLDSTQTVTTTLASIRSVKVSLLAKARNPDRKYTDSKTYTTAAGIVWGPYGDNFRRRFQTMTVKCRNMGL
jgi:type IV pilus assembly protein PilW